jgi:hypothetical protein
LATYPLDLASVHGKLKKKKKKKQKEKRHASADLLANILWT